MQYRRGFIPSSEVKKNFDFITNLVYVLLPFSFFHSSFPLLF